MIFKWSFYTTNNYINWILICTTIILYYSMLVFGISFLLLLYIVILTFYLVHVLQYISICGELALYFWGTIWLEITCVTWSTIDYTPKALTPFVIHSHTHFLFRKVAFPCERPPPTRECQSFSSLWCLSCTLDARFLKHTHSRSLSQGPQALFWHRKFNLSVYKGHLRPIFPPTGY